MLTLTSTLDALIHHPEVFEEGSRQLSFAIPTSGKRLSTLPTLPTLKVHPLFIFDQSKRSIFLENKRFIQSLNRPGIWHISRSDALKLAEKLGIRSLLETQSNGLMGYGGARNCVFLLTPLLRYGYEQGKNLPSILKTGKTQLRTCFQSLVLGEDPKLPSGHTIAMYDDDVEVPGANVLSHQFSAYALQKKYCISPGVSRGRETTAHVDFPKLEDIFEKPSNIFMFTRWTELPKCSIFAELLTKPKLCINLPYGNEEEHFKGIFFSNPLLQVSTHLGGTRYPLGPLPTHYIVGLEKHLEKFLPYSLHISLVQSLLDPSNEANRCALPWNKEEVLTTFRCLKDVLNYIVQPSTQEEMRKRFWENLHILIEESPSSMPLAHHLSYLMTEHVEKAIDTFSRKRKLHPEEKRSLEKMGSLYQFYQQDGKLLVEFGKRLLQHSPLPERELIEQTRKEIEKEKGIDLIQFPLTEALYLLAERIGACGFSQSIFSLLRQYQK